MNEYKDYLESIDNEEHKKKTGEVLSWVCNNYPKLGRRIAWNSPTFTDHETFIIGFNHTKNHLAVTPEGAGIRKFREELDQKGLKYGKMNINFPWEGEFDYGLLKKIIDFNIEDKKDIKTYWRRAKKS